jgi:autotransporter-associated beta strand protein
MFPFNSSKQTQPTLRSVNPLHDQSSMSTLQTFHRYRKSLCGGATALMAFWQIGQSLLAASATWNGTTDAIWATDTNWSASPVPGTGDTATFNSAGGAVDVIDLGAGVTVNSLVFDTANVAAYTIGSGGAGSQTLTLNGTSTISLNSTINANQLINANVALGTGTTITNNDATNTLTIAGSITGSASTLTKLGTGTFILSGLSTTAANNYTGTTILGGGTTTLTQDASFSGGLTFGATGGSTTVSNLNLNSASATFAGPMLVQTSSTGTPNTITIGAGEKLTINNNVSFSGVNYRSRLTVSGAGGWDVISSDGFFGSVGTTNGADTFLDMSGLAEFNANLRTGGSGSAGGVFRVGPAANTGTNGRDYTTSLATDSTISADFVNISLLGGTVGTGTLSLGNGTQIINSDNFTLNGAGASRGNAVLSFRTADGTLKVRGTDGGDATRSNLTMHTASTGSGTKFSTFNVTGHVADLLFDTVRIYDMSTSPSDSASDELTATFSFDRGILDATTFQIGTKSAGDLNSKGIGIANIGSSSNHSNTATLGTVNMGILTTGGGISVNGELRSTLNITGTATTVNFSTLSMANSTSADADAKVNSAVNISGGNVTGTGGIDMVSAFNAGTGNSTLTISGGNLSVGTSGVSATNGIYRTASTNTTATLLLNGGSLNLNGNNIGAAGANAITTQFESGTLSNVGEINGGAGLNKTTTGTLILSGTNTYTGTTTVTSGSLQVGVSGSGTTGTGAVTVQSGSTLLGTGVVRGATFTLENVATLRPGDSEALSSHGTLTFTPASASGSTSDLQGSIILGISGATATNPTFGGNVIGSAGYNAFVDAVTGVGSHDRLVFKNPTSGTGYNLNFLTTTGSLQVEGSSFTAALGQIFNLLDWENLETTNFSGFSFNSGYFTGNGDEGPDLDLPDLGSSGLLWDFSRFTTSGNIAIVPEPSRALLLMIGLLGLMARRYRK